MKHWDTWILVKNIDIMRGGLINGGIKMGNKNTGELIVRIRTKYIDESTWNAMRRITKSTWEHGTQVWDIPISSLPAVVRILNGVDIDTNDMSILLSEASATVSKLGYKRFKSTAEPIEVEGWKGEGDIEIQELGKVYRVIEHRKNKETGEKYHTQRDIPKSQVKEVWNAIRANAKLRENYDYRTVVKWIDSIHNFHTLEQMDINTFIEGFNGGKNRAKYYFPYYYYPLKIFESKGYLRYFGRGGIILTYDGELR